VRAGLFASIGERLYTGENIVFAVALMVAVLLLPFCVPRFRAQLLSALHNLPSSSQRRTSK